jgi:hypothetical protein
MLRTRLGRFSPAHPRNARELELFLKGPFRQGVPLLVGSVVTVDMPRRKTETGQHDSAQKKKVVIVVFVPAVCGAVRV